MKTICIIPARGGSKGLPRKNLLPLAGKPLLQYPIELALSSGVVDTVLVTTDDEEIAEMARDAGAVVPFLRPPTLAGDLTTTESTLQHALLTYEEMLDHEFEIGVFLTATDVFRKVEWVAEAVERLRADPALESVFAGYATHKNFWYRDDDGHWVRVLPWMRDYSSRQIRRAIIREDTGLACASRAWLWREGRRIGDRVDVVVNDDVRTAIDIHDERDLEIAGRLLPDWSFAADSSEVEAST